MFLIVGFYQSIVLFFLDGSESEIYFKNIFIWNMVFLCSGTGGGILFDYRRYSFDEILVDHSDDETEVVSVSITDMKKLVGDKDRETGGGGFYGEQKWLRSFP